MQSLGEVVNVKSRIIPILMALILLCSITPTLAETVKTVKIFTSETYSGTGWTTKTYSVDVSSISNAKQITIHISGVTQTDEFLRYLLVKVEGQIVNGHSLEDKPWTGYTAMVSSSFDLTYDVTNLVKGKRTAIVEVGLTTFTGSWTLNAEFNAVLEESITLPTNPQNPMTIKTTYLAAGLGLTLIPGAIYLRSRELE